MDESGAWKAEQRYRAVLEVRDGSPVSEVAVRYGVSRQTIHTWRNRYVQDGVVGLQEGSRRPKRTPTRVDTEVEALICELRRQHPRWGARRVRHELGRRKVEKVEKVPSRATVHRVLVRNGLINAQEQEHQRKYKRWQREAPMQLWQMDLVGGVFLADGRECKLVTGIDDHSRFVVIAAVVVIPTGRAVVEAFTAAMRRYGVPSEVLTDNGKQFTGRFTRPFPAEVLFERVCRENGISQRLTKRRSPTTTGKVERFHKTLREELLDEVAAFDSLDAAREAIDGWVHTYNHARPHQSLDMATPASLFRPSAPKPLTVPSASLAELETAPDNPPIVEEGPPPTGSAAAVEWEVRVPPCGHFAVAGSQQVWLGPAYSGRTVNVWADDRSIHLVLDGHHVKTIGSRLHDEHLRSLLLRGARPAGPAPAAPALPRAGRGRSRLPETTAVEVDRSVVRDGVIRFNNQDFSVDPGLVGQRITLRLDGHLMHAIADDQLVKSWPYPITMDKRLALTGARQASGPLPPAPSGRAPQAERRVPRDGVVMVARQRLRVGASHVGKIVTIIAEDTHFRVLDGDTELAIHPRKTNTPISRTKAWSKRR